LALTLDQITTAIRRRLGWPSGDTFVSDAELQEMVRQSRRELLDLLISVHQGDYRLTGAGFQTVAGQGIYLMSPFNPAIATAAAPDLQVDFLRIRKVALLLDGIQYPMRRWDIETDVDDLNIIAWDAGTDIRYRISSGVSDGDAEKYILFRPTPAAAYTVTVWGNIGLENASFSATDTINTLGNDEYLVLDGMLKCLQMEETDTSAVERQKARYIEMLQNNATPIDAGQAITIADVRGAWDDVDRFRRWW
jgi:hypothetical protein